MRLKITRPTAVIAFAAAVVTLASAPARAAETSISSSVPVSGYAGGTLAVIPLTANGQHFPQNTPWDYTGQTVADMIGIDLISLTLPLGSAHSSGPGDTNFNEFTLALDGIDTGLRLNGTWPLVGDQVGLLTFTGVPENAADILAALKLDDQLIGTILDRDPGDDFISLGSTQVAMGNATLVINGTTPGATPPPPAGVPLPAAAWMGLCTLAGAGAAQSVSARRRRGA